jgi:dihydroflavonol-4-reductase
MTTAAITGATGFLGANVAAELCARGVAVRATRRSSSKAAHVADLPLTWVDAELSSVDGLARAFEGADVVFHCAAAVTQTRFAKGLHKDTNVQGTKNVVDAARRAGVRRLVHTSSVVTCAMAVGGGPDVTEDDRWNFPELGLDEAYAVTKRDAELCALAGRGPDLDVVVVNPGFMLGPRDAKPSSGQLITEMAKGRILAVPSGVNNFVDVRDVARGMIAAFERGTSGERYILGGLNLPYAEMFALIAGVLGRRPPRVRVPDGLLMLVGAVADLGERLLGHELLLNSAVTRYSIEKGYRFSSARAMRELGYTLTPLETTVKDAVDWFRANGML